MSSNYKILSDSPLSIFESIYLGLPRTTAYYDYSYVVNPNNKYLTGKTIIINSPHVKNLDDLARSNKIIARFPIKCDNYELIPYDLNTELRLKCTYFTSRYVLTPYLLMTQNSIVYDPLNDTLLMDRYILGDDLYTDGYLNVAGYLKKKLERIS